MFDEVERGAADGPAQTGPLPGAAPLVQGILQRLLGTPVCVHCQRQLQVRAAAAQRITPPQLQALPRLIEIRHAIDQPPLDLVAVHVSPMPSKK